MHRVLITAALLALPILPLQAQDTAAESASTSQDLLVEINQKLDLLLQRLGNSTGRDSLWSQVEREHREINQEVKNLAREVKDLESRIRQLDRR